VLEIPDGLEIHNEVCDVPIGFSTITDASPDRTCTSIEALRERSRTGHGSPVSHCLRTLNANRAAIPSNERPPNYCSSNEAEYHVAIKV
jgi:hypothetical protein